MPPVNSMLNKAMNELAMHGVLLKSDPKLPSVTTLVAGEPVRGSWWGHPLSHQIFGVLEALGDREDTTLVKLISEKDTFVHKTLFSHLISIGTARESWQLDGLSAAAHGLLDLVDKHGAIRTDELRLTGMKEQKSIGESARELEKALLVRGKSLHTSSGKHAKCLESWERWADRIGAGDRISANYARKELERIMESLNCRFRANGRLPWFGKAD